MNTKRALALAAVLLLVATSVVGCQTADNGGGGNGGEEIGAVTVMGLWGGTELEAFEAVVAGWEAETGGTVEFESTRDLSAILRTRVEGGNPPDLAILPNPALMQEFAGSGKLLAIDDVLDMNTIGDDYGKAWTDLGTIDGKLYGLFVKAATKSTVWYNPTVFSEKGYTTPTTWDELIALSDKIKTDAGVPWSIGIEAGAATGWPATDWIQEILLAESGPDVYDQWVNHEIPWTDDAVKSAFERFGEIALADGYVVGGVNSTLATKPEDASYLPFESPPKAYLYFLGAFTQNFVAAQFPDLVAGEDYDFFKFPPIDPANAGAVTGGADVLSMFKDTPSSRSLMEYLADGANWESWATAGGFSSPSLALNASAYPDDLAAKAAAQLTESEIFRFDADDLMPAELQTAYFSATANYLQNPGQLDAILTSLEEVAKTAYAK